MYTKLKNSKQLQKNDKRFGGGLTLTLKVNQNL